MRDAGLEPALLRHGRAFTEPEGARLCEELLDAGEPFTAIVADNDLMALGCYDVFAARGIDCPDDISVVGFNDMPFGDCFSPPLTTIGIPHYEMASRRPTCCSSCCAATTRGRARSSSRRT